MPRPTKGSPRPPAASVRRPPSDHPACTLDLQTLGIAADHDPEMTLRGAGGLPAASLASSASSPDEILNAGGRGYGMRELLGQGGMGAVYRCKQKIFGRSLAAKMILPERNSERTQAAFLAEAAVVSHLAHPHIIPVHDLLQHPQKGPILVMKQVQGHEWMELLQAGITDTPVADPQRDLRRTVDEHLDILLDVCDALTFAHSKGILHRDLKPQNVMIGAHGEVLVMDWGCAVSLDQEPPHPQIPLATDLKGISGTPGYLPPEMAMGEHHRLCPASDVYLLGGILYQILTGRPPHRGGDTPSTGGSSHAVQAVLASAAQGIVPDPQVVTDGQRPCPSGLCRLVMRALHKDPAKRIPSASALAAQIRVWRQREAAKQYLKQAQRLLNNLSHVPATEHLDSVLQAQAAITAATAASPQYPPIAPLARRCRLAQATALLAQGAIDQAAGLADQLSEQDDDSPAQAQRLNDLHDDLIAAQQTRRKQRRLRMLAIYGGGSFVAAALLVMVIAVITVWQQAASAERAMAEWEKSRSALDAATQQAASAEADLEARAQHLRDIVAEIANARTEVIQLRSQQQQIPNLLSELTTRRDAIRNAVGLYAFLPLTWEGTTRSDAIRDAVGQQSEPSELLRSAWTDLPIWPAFYRLHQWSQSEPLAPWNNEHEADWQQLADAWPTDHSFLRFLAAQQERLNVNHEIPIGEQDEEQITDTTETTDGSQPNSSTPQANADTSNLRAFQDPITHLWMATPLDAQKPWEATLQGGKERVALRGMAGTMTRSIDLPAGAWRIWLNGYNKHQEAILTGQWGKDQQLSNSRPRSGSYQWLALDGVLRLTEPTTVDLLLSFITPDLESPWFIREILIAEEGLTDPSLLADGQAQAAAWTPIKPPESGAPPVKPQTMTFDRLPQGLDAWNPIPHWNSQYLTQPRLSPLVSRAATELPYHVGDSFAESIRFDQLQGGSGGRPVSGRDGHFTVLQLAQPVDLSTGHISLLIFPNHRGRRQLELRLLDQRGIAAPHPLAVDVDPEAGWQVVRATIPEVWMAKALAEQAERPADRDLRNAAIDPRHIKTLAIVDPKTSNSLSFYLGAVGLQPSEAPSPESMWRPRALLRANVPNLATLHRRGIDPNLVRVLAPVHFGPEWRTALRAELAGLLNIERLPNKAVAQLTMHDEALDEEFIKEYLGNDVQHHLVIVITAGIEFHTGQNRKQALTNFWVKMMDEARRSDFLPVVVLGPTKVNEQFVAESDPLWEELETLISNDPRFMDVPIIDLRVATAIDYEQFAPGRKQMSLDLLTQGYAELRDRLRSIISSERELPNP